jgi:hypothetical protein
MSAWCQKRTSCRNQISGLDSCLFCLIAWRKRPYGGQQCDESQDANRKVIEQMLHSPIRSVELIVQPEAHNVEAGATEVCIKG